MPNEFGEYAEPVGAPYAEWKTVEQAATFQWPDPDWFDYSAIPSLCNRYPDLAIAAGAFHVQDFINGAACQRVIEVDVTENGKLVAIFFLHLDDIHGKRFDWVDSFHPAFHEVI